MRTDEDREYGPLEVRKVDQFSAAFVQLVLSSLDIAICRYISLVEL